MDNRERVLRREKLFLKNKNHLTSSDVMMIAIDGLDVASTHRIIAINGDHSITNGGLGCDLIA